MAGLYSLLKDTKLGKSKGFNAVFEQIPDQTLSGIGELATGFRLNSKIGAVGGAAILGYNIAKPVSDMRHSNKMGYVSPANGMSKMTNSVIVNNANKNTMLPAISEFQNPNSKNRPNFRNNWANGSLSEGALVFSLYNMRNG